MSNNTPTDRQALAVRVLDALCHPVFGLHDHLKEAHGIASGLAELLHLHADWAHFHQETPDPECLRALGKAIRQQVEMADAIAEQLAIEAREVKE